MNEASFGLAVSAGLVASLNPCAFAMLPAFAAYYLGLGEDARAQPGVAVQLARGVAVGAAMSAGFLVVFAGIGIVVSLAGSRLLRYQDVAGLVIGIALGAVGSWLVSGRELHVFVPNPVQGRRRGRDLVSASAYGVGYGFASLACTLPIFLVVVGTAFTNGSLLGGFELFVAYSLGMASVVVAVTLGAALFKGLVARLLRTAMPFVQRGSGALLILAGTYIAVRQLSEAKLGTLAPLQPHATEIGAALALASVLAAAVLWWLGGAEAGTDRLHDALQARHAAEGQRNRRHAEPAASRKG
ncbi:MAG TPA: cytochrome c biogenesis CcdA family protein [Gaiellaceae bacterium]|nr:cytochrome c biogenesis CcdA family protein [Gaiellaceae bacterium]